jgi:uridine kinase
MSANENRVVIRLPQLDTEVRVPRRTTPLEILDRMAERFTVRPAAVLLDGQLQHLTARLYVDGELEFVPMASREGGRVFRRSLVALMTVAARTLFPNERLKVEHSMGKGLFCTIPLKRSLRKADVEDLSHEMRRLVAEDVPFERLDVPLSEALDHFSAQGSDAKIALLSHSARDVVRLCRVKGIWELWNGPFFPSASWVKDFDLRYYPPGFVLSYPYWMEPRVMPQEAEQPKLFGVFREYERWGEILGAEHVGDLNRTIMQGGALELINITESLHEKKIGQIADGIRQRFPEARVVLIAGPSSSGKTTFSKRLSTQLRVNALTVQSISLDDYFLNREQTPRDAEGNFDFESLEAIDVPLFNQHLVRLLDGDEVEIPRFDFKTGARRPEGVPLRLGPRDVMVIEGIHGLNEGLTAQVPHSMKHKVYCSALTHLNFDRETVMSTTDTRLLRRLVRDRMYRGYSGEETLTRWESVNRGEYRNIFPFQEEADVMFNSALVYEHAVLSTYVLPILMTVPRKSPVYNEARRLVNLLSYFLPLPAERVPHTSILREFIGGSSFYN